MQRAPTLVPREGVIGGAGAFSRLVDLPDNDRVQREAGGAGGAAEATSGKKAGKLFLYTLLDEQVAV
jgi:hypothetical protein